MSNSPFRFEMVKREVFTTKKGILAAIIFFCTVCMITPGKAEAASAKCLKEGKNYYYDLNHDGKKEKVSYSTKTKNDGVSVTIYVNKKKVYSEVKDALAAHLYYTDFNSKDKYKDLYLQYQSDSVCFVSAKILNYKNGKLKTICTKKDNNKDFTGRRELSTKQKGNGTVTITADTPFNYGSLGCYYVEMDYKIKKGTLVKCSQTYYSVSDNWSRTPYTLTKKMKFTKTRTGRTTAFTRHSGDKVYMNQIYCKKNGSVIYVQMRTKSGKKGWFKVTESNFYREEYGWG